MLLKLERTNLVQILVKQINYRGQSPHNYSPGMCGPCTLKIFLAVTSWPHLKHVASWFGLPFPHLFVALCIPTYHVRNNYIMHIPCYFTLVDFGRLL